MVLSREEVGLEEFDLAMMGLALEMAAAAGAKGEVPVGAVLTDASGLVLAATGNDCVAACDPVGHAEIRVLREGATRLNNYRLPGTTLYVTLEPCCMCASAMIHARVKRLVFGAEDPKAGAIVSKYKLGSDGLLNHSFAVRGGVLADDCGRLLKEFFRKRRNLS